MVTQKSNNGNGPSGVITTAQPKRSGPYPNGPMKDAHEAALDTSGDIIETDISLNLHSDADAQEDAWQAKGYAVLQQIVEDDSLTIEQIREMVSTVRDLDFSQSEVWEEKKDSFVSDARTSVANSKSDIHRVVSITTNALATRAGPDNLHLLLTAVRLYGYDHPNVKSRPHCLFCMKLQAMDHTQYLSDGTLVNCPLGQVEDYLISHIGVTPEWRRVEDASVAGL